MTYEELVAVLVRDYGCDRPTAEKRARATIDREARISRILAPAPPRAAELHVALAQNQQLIDMIDDVPHVPRENTVRGDCEDLYATHHCTVYSTSQFRPSKTSVGYPDAFIFPPTGKGAGWWHEYKRPGGARTSEQERFKQLCSQSGTPYVCGGTAAAEAMLRQRGILPR